MGSIALVLALLALAKAEVWEKDMTEEVYIAGTFDGFDNVHLECKKESMKVTVELEEDFEGIFYTRGSYKEAKAPCFYDADGGQVVSLDIPYDGCKTKEQDGAYVNTVIVQYDDLLIFPGDTAFEIKCNKTQEQEILVTASIGLADPDPGAKELPKHRKSTVFGENDVTFRPTDIRPKQKSANMDKKKAKKKKKKKKVKLRTKKDEL